MGVRWAGEGGRLGGKSGKSGCVEIEGRRRGYGRSGRGGEGRIVGGHCRLLDETSWITVRVLQKSLTVAGSASSSVAPSLGFCRFVWQKNRVS